MKIFFVSTALALMLIPAAHAGWGDMLSAAAQAASGQSAPAENNADSATGYNTTPISTDELEQMSCAKLAVTAKQTQRELTENKAKLQQLEATAKNPEFQQQQSNKATVGMVGGLIGQFGKGSAAEYGNAMSQDKGLNINQQIDQELALNKKLQADLDSIEIYQDEKKCKKR
ncbi:MAG: hypothetical protein VXW65_12395 [Pseudomonadota bacterium]|nr:hypothetical protein [Pseudomonadota bacterium]